MQSNYALSERLFVRPAKDTEIILQDIGKYGKVQSVKILPQKEEESGFCATVAFIDIKSASKAHNADNKIDDRTLKTDYYQPPASSTSSSAIYIHERDDALVRPAPAPYTAGRTPRYGFCSGRSYKLVTSGSRSNKNLSEERNYERPGHYYADREPYMRRPIGIGYHDEDSYQGRAKSRDRYPRSTPGNNYTEGTERNQNHFRPHNARQHFDQQRYPVGDQYNDEREPAAIPPRLNRRTNNTPTTPTVASVASPTTLRTENRPRRSKRRSPSRTPSGSRSNSRSRSRSRSSSGSRSSSSSSKLRSSSSDSSGRSRSPSKSRSPVNASYNSQNNAKGSRLDRPSSAIANPSSTACYLPSAVNTSAINCTSNNTQGSTPSQSCTVPTVENHCDREEKRPLGICVRNLPVRSTDTSLKDGLFHEYKKHGKVTMVKVIGQGTDRYAVVCFKKPEDVDKALEVSKDKLFFGCKIEVTAHEGLDAEDNEFRPLEAELDEFHPKATRTLFIGNLEKDITTPELRKHFEQFGEIIEVDIKKQGTASSYAFIQYSDIASVVKAMRKLDGENLGANRIKLGFGKSMPTNCVWLDGIVDSVSDKFLARHFSRFGLVAYTAIDREKGHALVFYESVEFAQIAVSEMRGRILQGKKLQVDFASRECQTAFFEKLEMTGQMIPGDGTRPWERRERRGPEFELVRNDDREQRVGFENRTYPRYEGQPRPPRGNFRGGQRAGFASRGRGQGFPARYEVYHDEFGERRHRYNSRDESVPEVTMFDGKIERPAKYVENADCPNRKRNKLRNSISDQESHHSLSPPRSCHQSRSTSPVSKDRKSLKERLHHRIKSPGSHTSSLVSSPCRDTVSDEMETNSDYRDSRSKNEIKADEVMADLSYTSPRSSSEKDCSEKGLSKGETDSIKSRSSVDAESADESISTSDQLGQLERKKRLLASSNLKACKELNTILTKSLSERAKGKMQGSHVNSLKPTKVNCVTDTTVDDAKFEMDNISVQQECVKEKLQQTESANDLKSLQKKQVRLLHLLEQLGDNANSNDTEGLIDGERVMLKKHRSPSSCSETNPLSESGKLTKDECSIKLAKDAIRDSSVLNKLKTKADSIDSSNCISLSLDSFIFQKHLDPRKGSDHLTALQKGRRISMDNETCLPNAQGAIDAFLCAASPINTDGPWKKDSISDIHFPDSDNDGQLTVTHPKGKDEIMSDEDVLSNKKSLNSSFPLDVPNRLLSLRTLSDMRHEIKRDISPLSLPLPKFAASLRSPKSSPSVLTSPKSTAAHSPRAGFSPSSYASGKNIRISDLLQDFQMEKKTKDIVTEEKVNGATVSPVDSISPIESNLVNEVSETISNVESIQSPKSIADKIKELHSSSESEFSPSASPNRPSIEDRIKALDEKFNAWSGSTRTASAIVPDAVPIVTPEIMKCPVKRSRFNFLAPEIREPSEIVKSLLARSTIFDQDSKRLQHIDEKYEPLDIKVDASPPRVKPTFRTKAAAKEFSSPIAPAVQKLNQSSLINSPTTVLVAQSIVSPPATPQSVVGSVLSPVTPPVQYNTPLTPQAFTPCSPCAAPFSLTSATIKNSDNYSISLSDHVSKVPNMFNSVKTKAEANFHMNSSTLATSLKSPLHCSVDVQSQALVLNSPPNIRKEPASPVDNATEAVCKFEIECKVPIKKELPSHNVISIPLRKENSVSFPKDHIHFNSFDHNKKEICDSKDSKLSFHEGASHWRENGCKDEIKSNLDSCAKSFSSNPGSDSSVNPLCPAAKKRVSSIDSTESESSKSVKSLDSSRDSQETNWSKHEKTSEPEPKKPKLSKSATRDRSVSPPVQLHSRKIEKKEKNVKPEKCKVSSSKSTTSNIPEKSKSDTKCSSKSEQKEKSKPEHKNKEEKRSKSRESKESTSKEQRTKSRERRNSEKDKSGVSNNPSNKSKKESHSNKNENKHETKSETKHETKSEAKHETKIEAKHETKSEVKHETKSEVKHETKSEAKHESKSEAKHESKSEAKHESKKESKQESKNISKHKNKMETKYEIKNESDSECKTEDSKNEKKQNEKKSKKSSVSSLPFDIQAFLENEPVYFSMYDKVKARSSKSQTLKHQTGDLESVRQKFSKLKQSRAKREEKTKVAGQDSDKDSDSGSHHSSESDSQTKSTKIKQPRKRKLVIQSSSDDDAAPQDSSNRTSKIEKDFSDSATDSDFDYNVSRRQSSSLKVRKKKTDLLNSDSSDSDSNFASKSQSSSKKKSSQSRSKSRLEKTKKLVKSDYELSDTETHQKSKEKDMKPKKLKKEKTVETKAETESMDYEVNKKSNDDMKSHKKKASKEMKPDPDTTTSQKKLKADHVNKEKSTAHKEKKRESSVEKMQIDDMEKHKPYTKKRKKSKKMSKNKEKRSCTDKAPQESSRNLDDHDVKSSLPVLSPKPSNLLPEKQLSPPCLQAGFSDNDFKSDFSDFDFGTQQTDDVDITSDIWKQLDAKSDSNSEKSTKSKRKDSGPKNQYSLIHSPEQDSSLPSFFDKLSDVTDSETGREPADCTSDVPSEKRNEFSLKKEKDIGISSSPFKSKHEDHVQKQEMSKYSDAQSTSSKEGRRKKKSKKQSKEKKKKREVKDQSVIKDAPPSVPATSPKPLFEPLPIDEDSRLSDIRLDEDTRRFEQEFLVVPQEASVFGEEGPTKKEEKLLERRFEEEAAKETRRLEAELFSTGRDSWHMKEKDYDPEANAGELCEDKHLSEIDSLTVKDEGIFTGLDLHSSVSETPQSETEAFLTGHTESDNYKIDDKDMNEIEDQRKIEDDLAVSALLQEMHCGEISAPELTKETDYLDPLIETHPEDTMNYLLPDDGENSLHIADSPPDVQGIDNPDEKLEGSVMLLSPSSNSEPPALEISNVEDSSTTKVENTVETDVPETSKVEPTITNEVEKECQPASCYEFQEDVEVCESKPPVIDIPNIPDSSEQKKVSLSPKVEHAKVPKTRGKENQSGMPKPESNEDTDNESISELAENQLTHFEDITMDTTDSKDDDNPPILLPVESPRNLLTAAEPKEKVEVPSNPLEEDILEDSIDKPPSEAVSEAESNSNKLPTTDINIISSDIEKQFGEILNRFPEQQRNEKKSSSNSDSRDACSVPLHMSELSDHNSNDSLLLTNPGIFDHCDSSPISLKPFKSFDSDEPHISNAFDDESNDKYLSESLATAIDQPLISYSSILNPICDSVIKSPHKAENNNSIALSSKSNVQSFTESGDAGTISDTNHGSSDSFLLDLFGPKSVENEAVDNGYLSEKTENDNGLICNSDSKNKNDDSELFSETNQSSHDNPSFQISEVNEQNEATEFNQEIFERSSDASKSSKLPQLLSFSSDQLFTDLPNKPNSEMAGNVSPNESKAESNETDMIPVDEIPVTEPEKDDIPFHPEESEPSLKIDEEETNVKNLENFNDEPLIVEDNLDIKSRPADAESVCSDTTDITIPEIKSETEASHVVSSEEPVQEDPHVGDVSTTIKPKVERPRRGRRPKTRKYLEAISQKQDIDSSLTVTHTRSSSRRMRQASTERVRRSLRSDTSEPTILRECTKKRCSVDEPIQSETEEAKKDTSGETSDHVSDSTTTEVESVSGSVSSVIVEQRLADKSHIPHEEPRKRRGRRKKASGDNQNLQLTDKMDSKFDDSEVTKDLHRPKESRLLLSLSSCDKEQKVSKDSTSKAIDVYEFVDEEYDRALTFESVKEKLHDTIRNNSSSNDTKSDKAIDLKHNKIFESKHDKGNDQKHDKGNEQKHEKGTDQKHEKGNDQKHEKGNEQKKHDKGGDQKHEKVGDQKHDKAVDLKSEKCADNHEKEKKDAKKSVANEERDVPVKEHHPEVKEQKRISITIRLHQKDGHDGTSPGTAEVVKTTETVNIEEVKPEPVKTEKSSKHDSSTLEPPCKSTRKSTRLMKQAAQRSTIDDVGKGSGKNSNTSHSEPPPTRVTRRSKSNRRSEENSTKDLTPSENSSDLNDDKNKNEPVFFIHDNAVKDIHDDKRKVSGQPTEISSSTDATMTESDKIQTRGGVQSLRNFRLRSTSRMESSKDTTSSNKESEVQKKETVLVKPSEEIMEIPQPKDSGESKDVPKETKTLSDSTRVFPPLPVLKVEINKLKIENSKEIPQNSEKQSENEEDSNSRSSPAVLVDPITGLLGPVSGSYTDSVSHSLSENKKPESAISTSVLNIKNASKTVISTETASATSVIQESSKSGYVSKNENIPERPPLVQILRPRQVSGSISSSSTLTTETSPINSESNSKPPVQAEKSTEHVKLPAKKNSMAASVLTMANAVVPSSTISTVTVTDSVNTSSVYTQSSQGQSPVISRTTNISSHDNAQVKVSSHSVHSYDSPIRTTAVVTSTSASHLTSNSSAVSIKTSTAASVSTSTTKSELPPVYTSANIPPTSTVSEHISSVASCKPLPLNVSGEHSNILVKQEVHTTSASIHSVPVPTTWTSSKIPSNRITDAHAHVSTIQSTASSNSTHSSKLEVRPSKVPHPSRSNSAFTQQTAFQISNYDDPLSGAHSLSSSGGVIADLLQNQFLQHKEYFVPGGQHHDANIVQMVRSNTPGASNIPPELARLGESPHTPTPPITSSSHPLPSTDSHSHVNTALHLRQPPIMVPPHSSRSLHHPELASLMHQQMMFAHSTYPHHSDLRVQQDVRAMGINSHYGYHAMPASSDVSNNFKQPPQHRHQSSIMDAKAEQKVVDDLSKVLHETRAAEEKSQRSKSMRSKKDFAPVQKEKELKMMYSENREDVESSRLVPSTSAIAPHNSRQPQHAHFASQILQMSPHIPSPHDRTTDSPVTANLYNAQGRLSQIPLAGQVDERSLGAHSSHLYKNDTSEGIKPPIAHQTQPSTSPYHSRQQLLGVPQIGSTAPAHIDGRSSNPAHSPNSHSYKKDSHSQQIASLHNPAIDKIVSSEHSAKGYNVRTISRQGGSSISPGPWSSGLQSQSPRPPMILNEQSAHVPPPAHAMSQATNVAISHQPPSHASQHADQFLLQRYPVIWQGILALKNDQAAVQMHFVSGNLNIARLSLPAVEPFDPSPLRIAQRMRLEPQQLEGVKKKLQMVEEHCVLMALPCGKDHVDVFQQSNNLRNGFINYLQRKSAAGIVNTAHPGTQQPAYVVHIFPTCDFTNLNLTKIAPDLLKLVCEIAHLVIVIATV
ncbi:protein split ends-like isoform X2 [Argiope bruennichi]|uniref:protein split ends-like isoform X2 n=1 Tax=Argiope bruennichi TaxID=94029 RepID=UPI002493D055|nr:protein split ends-like isoform X2 [Argiope bruennichi]